MRPRALVVDGSLTVRMDLRSALANAGFLVMACSTKAVAWATLQNGGIKLVLLDIHLPDGSGLDLLKQIRSDPALNQLQTILLNSEAEVQAGLAGFACGADRYVPKPYERDYLARVARDLCQMQLHGEPPSSRRALSGKKILLVDDASSFSSTLAEQMRRDGIAVVLARHNEEALALLTVETFACVLLSLSVSGGSGLSGLETCRRIRQLAHGREALVLVLASSDHPSVRQEVLAAGGDGVALRTPPLESLRTQVRSLLMQRPDALERAAEVYVQEF